MIWTDNPLYHPTYRDTYGMQVPEPKTRWWIAPFAIGVGATLILSWVVYLFTAFLMFHDEPIGVKADRLFGPMPMHYQQFTIDDAPAFCLKNGQWKCRIT